MSTTTKMSIMDRLAYRGPEIDQDGVKVTRFTVGDDSSFGSFISNLRYELQGRKCEDGTYYRLDVDNTLWMSDTTAEKRDHRMAIAMADMSPGGTGLVNGLGMGCVIGAMLDSLSHVDVVESDERIIDTVGAWYVQEYGDRVTIHHDDALTIRWPVGTCWDVVWHDIWPHISTDNLPEMSHLHRRYGKRSTRWQGSWCRYECERVRREEAKYKWW